MPSLLTKHAIKTVKFGQNRQVLHKLLQFTPIFASFLVNVTGRACLWYLQ
ncbi:hypothetical protein [Moraxella lacunata]